MATHILSLQECSVSELYSHINDFIIHINCNSLIILIHGLLYKESIRLTVL